MKPVPRRLFKQFNGSKRLSIFSLAHKHDMQVFRHETVDTAAIMHGEGVSQMWDESLHTDGLQKDRNWFIKTLSHGYVHESEISFGW